VVRTNNDGCYPAGYEYAGLFVDPRDEIRQNQAIDLLKTLGELGIGRFSAQNLAEFMNSTRKLSA
jgi:hypothetical protein